MRTPLVAVFSAWLCVVLLACAGKTERTPDGTTAVDSGGSLDGASVADHGPAADTQPPGDGSAAGDQGGATGDGHLNLGDGGGRLGCRMVRGSWDTCRRNCPATGKEACVAQCTTTASARACAPAAPLFSALMTCVDKSCKAECTGEAGGCSSCITESCADESSACNRQWGCR